MAAFAAAAAAVVVVVAAAAAALLLEIATEIPLEVFPPKYLK